MARFTRALTFLNRDVLFFALVKLVLAEESLSELFVASPLKVVALQGLRLCALAEPECRLRCQFGISKQCV